MQGLTITEKGINLIKHFEGCALTGYRCPAGKMTIGYGHTGTVNGNPITEKMQITQQQAEVLLRQDLQKYEAKVRAYHPQYRWNQNEYDALVSFCYNIGSIHQLTRQGGRTRAEIAQAMLRYVRAGNQVLPGLVRRREAEQQLFLTPTVQMASPTDASNQATDIQQQSIPQTASRTVSATLPGQLPSHSGIGDSIGTIEILLDGQSHQLDGLLYQGRNYVSLRQLATLLGASVSSQGSMAVVERGGGACNSTSIKITNR